MFCFMLSQTYDNIRNFKNNLNSSFKVSFGFSVQLIMTFSDSKKVILAKGVGE